MPRKSIHYEVAFAFDKYANAFTVIDENHRHVHDGFAYHAVHRIVDLANSASVEFLLKVPAATYPHLHGLIALLEGAPCDVTTFEGTTVSADGSALTAINRNRSSALTSGLSIYSGPTITGDGTQIHDRYLPSPAKDAGIIASGHGEEWVLNASTNYLIRLTNNSGAIMDGTMEFLWYEIGEDS